MNTALPVLLAIIAFVIVLNFVMLFFRLRRDKYKKPNKEILEEKKAVLIRDREITRRLNREQEDAVEFVEKRNKTLALYEECRKRAAERESGDGGTPESEALEECSKLANGEPERIEM